MYSKRQLALTKKDIGNLNGSITVGLAFSLVFFTIGLLLSLIYQSFIFLGWQFPVYEKIWMGVAAIIGYAGLFVLIFLVFFLYKTIIERLDIVRGKKTYYYTDHYQIIEKKSDLYIKINSPVKKRIDLLDNRLKEMIDTTKPLTVEVTKYSKTVLFISNNMDNLLDKLEEIDELEYAAFENGKE
ncbi:hypothetical protein GXP67_17720 [Rhodocytophaga rosea]|uniref:Uncharacterized protein n=1 Tax=Rhodocytophaga rosea TaxID=2704465 RepID=A0A6C0GJZ1_9BACT|nr:hypothetical protein [Rhodocytophaga rosea]QHT68348.1 hypothetical protein GXP67_17720 [Rhodocytophaga rosea]